MKFLLILVFSLTFSTCFAQIKFIDQLNEAKIKSDSLLKIEEYDQAANLFEKIMTKVDIIDALLYYEIATVYYTQNDHPKTLANLDKSLALAQKSKDEKILSIIHLLYARIYSKQGNGKKTIAELKKSLKYNDQLLESHVTLSYEYLQSGKNKKALQEANKAIEIDPKMAYSYNNAGLALVRLKRYDEANEMITTSLELNPSNPYAYKHLAYYFLAVNQVDKACQALHKAEELKYKDFGNEYDQNEVADLIKKHCK